MVTIIKKSKRSIRANKVVLSASDAKKFLFQLEDKDLNVDDYIVFSADTQDEYIDVVGFFSPSFLPIRIYEGFDAHVVQKDIAKDRRMRQTGATITAIENFKVKIQKLLMKMTDFYDDFTIQLSVTTEYNIDSFVIIIIFPFSEAKMRFTYAYDLQMIDASIVPMNVEKDIPALVLANITKKVNALFNKQRYYYKKKVENNVKTEN
jgi:hypothetical protein